MPMTPEYFEHDMQALRDERDRLKAALVGLVGAWMPIPTPAPPVKEFDENDLTIARAIIHQLAHDSVEGLNLPGVARLFDRMAALLLQRAQESHELLQAVLEAIKGTIDTSTNIADHPNVKFAQMERLKLESALTARAQEIEQVKAENATLGEMLENSYQARRELQAQIDAADAALVSRAPQPEP